MEAVQEIRQGTGVDRRSVRPYSPAQDVGNDLSQFILVLKPEVLDTDNDAGLERVLSLLVERASAFAVELGACVVMGGREIAASGFVRSEYPILNRAAHDAMGSLTPSAAARLATLSPDLADRPASVVGAFEFLDLHRGISALALETLHRNVRSVKLGAGLYAIRVYVDGEPTVIVNAFHPRQVADFEHPRSQIVIFEARSRTPFSQLRRSFVGDIDPSSAEAGSLRAELHRGCFRLGLRALTTARNAVHISAALSDAMFGVLCYFPTLANGRRTEIEHTAFGLELLSRGWSQSSVSRLEEASIPDAHGRLSSVADVTEGCSMEQAVAVLGRARLRRAIR